MIDRAVELVPNMAALLVQRSLVLAYAGRFAEAREACRQVIEVLPNSLICHAGIMFNSLQLGEPVQEQDVRALESRLGSNRLVALLPQLAYLYARVGAPADAERLIAEVEAIGQQRDIGVGTRIIAAIARDDRAEVRRWLETAIAKIERHEPDAGYFDVMTVRGNSLASPLLNEPEFRDLRAKLGRL